MTRADLITARRLPDGHVEISVVAGPDRQSIVMTPRVAAALVAFLAHALATDPSVR